MILTEFKDLYENDLNFHNFVNDLISLGHKYVKIVNLVNSDFSKDNHQIDGLSMTDVHKIFVTAESSMTALVNNEVGKIIQNYLQKKEEN